MAYKEEIADLLSTLLIGDPDIPFVSKRMFGGITFLYHNKMVIGVWEDRIFFRILSEHIEKQLQSDHLQVLEFGGKPMKEFLSASPMDGHEFSVEEMIPYINFGLEHASSKLNIPKVSLSDI